MKGRKEAPYALRRFIDDVGLPECIISDNAPELRSNDWKKILRDLGIKERPIEPYHPWQNYAENSVKMVKFRALKLMELKRVPLNLWDHTLEYACGFSNKCYHSTHRLDSRTPYEFIHGITPDISPYMDFEFYEPVFYILNDPGIFPMPKRRLGRWLGPARQPTSDLVSKVLTKGGLIVNTSSIFPIPDDHNIQADIEAFDAALREKITPKSTQSSASEIFGIKEPMPTDGPAGVVDSGPRVVGSVGPRYEDSITPEDVGSPMKTHGIAPLARVDGGRGGWESARIIINDRRGTVKNKKRDAEGEVIGIPHSNPLLDTTIYNVEFDDGVTEKLSAKLIADSTIGVMDSNKQFEFLILDEILEAYPVYKNSVSPNHKGGWFRTDGWHLVVRWKDGSEETVGLPELKETYPVAVAEYAKAVGIDKEPAFAWWVPHSKVH